MKFLLDTCAVSELVKSRPNGKVIAWIEAQQETDLHLSVLTLAELERGVAKLGDSSKKEMLETWLNEDLTARFEHRILPVDEEVARTWGRIQADAEKQGQRMPIIDSLIATTAIAHGLTVVTRNIKDMAPSGAKLLNLWEET